MAPAHLLLTGANYSVLDELLAVLDVGEAVGLGVAVGVRVAVGSGVGVAVGVGSGAAVAARVGADGVVVAGAMAARGAAVGGSVVGGPASGWTHAPSSSAVREKIRGQRAGPCMGRLLE